MDLSYKFISQLDEAERALTSDWFLISQNEAYDLGGELMSRKLSYANLSALLLNNIDNLISVGIYGSLSVLSAQISSNTNGIIALSDLLDDTVSAVIKIANCVQVNKSNISSISSILDNLDADRGIQLTKNANNWKIGHELNYSTTAAINDNVGLYKIKTDAYGHVSKVSSVISNDIKNIGGIVCTAGEGLYTSTNGTTVNLKKATNNQLGGIKVGDNLSITNEGVLSAKDTIYSAGSGLNLNNTIFSLKTASSTDLGGVKINGNNLKITNGVLSAKDTTYEIANSETPGIIKVNLTDNNYIPVKVNDDGYAYIDKNIRASFSLNSTVNLDEKSNITQIHIDNNGLSVISSYYLYNKINELSNRIKNIPTANNFYNHVTTRLCIQPYDNKYKLTLKDGETSVNVLLPPFSELTAAYLTADDNDNYVIRFEKNTDDENNYIDCNLTDLDDRYVLNNNTINYNIVDQISAVSDEDLIIDYKVKIYKYETTVDITIDSIDINNISKEIYPIDNHLYSFEIWIKNINENDNIQVTLPDDAVLLTDYNTVSAGKTAVFACRHVNETNIISYSYEF